MPALSMSASLRAQIRVLKEAESMLLRSRVAASLTEMPARTGSARSLFGFWLVVVLLAALAVVAAGGTPRVENAAATAPSLLAASEAGSGVIAFVSERRDGVPGIYAIGPEGGHVHKLVAGAVAATAVVWGPGRGRLTFFGYRFNASDRAHTGGIWTVAPNGSGLRVLIQYLDPKYPSLAWSPDGRLLAVRTPTGIVLFDRNGRRVRRLTHGGYNFVDAWSPDGQAILFDGWGPSFYTVRPDGTGLRKVADGEGAAWSPDGKRLAFYNRTRKLSRPQLMVVDADGRNPHPLLVDQCWDSGPVWSSRDEIAFSSSCGNRPNTIDVVRSDGSKRRTILVDAPGSYRWSPDGTKLVYTDTRQNIDVIDADGSDRHALFPAPGGFKDPAWSRDGALTVVANAGERLGVLREGKIVDVHRAGRLTSPSWAPDGQEVIADTPPGYALATVVDVAKKTSSSYYIGRNFFDPSWSPGGRRILFSDWDGEIRSLDLGTGRDSSLRVPVHGANPEWSPDGRHFAYNRPKARGIVVVDADGSHPLRLTTHGYEPTWSPDGRHIAFVRNVTSTNPEIFVVDLDGTGLRRLTFHQGYDGDPAWSPRRTGMRLTP